MIFAEIPQHYSLIDIFPIYVSIYVLFISYRYMWMTYMDDTDETHHGAMFNLFPITNECSLSLVQSQPNK